MSEETDFCTETVFVTLLHEGTTVLRPTRGIRLSDGVYRLLPTIDYDAETEAWQFPPGSVVECQLEERSGKRVLVARNTVSDF